MATLSHAQTLREIFEGCSTGMATFASRRSDDVIVTVGEVEAGSACDCACIVCGTNLIARKGKVRRHHFAHTSVEVDPDCDRAGETLLHRYAKSVLDGERRLTLPEQSVCDQLGKLTVAKRSVLDFDGVDLEKRFGDVVPDVVCTKAGRQLFVEFVVTHACPPEKLSKLARMDVGVVEIDLSSYLDVPLRELDEIILHLAPRTMLQSRHMDLGRVALKKRDEAHRAKEIEKKRRKVEAKMEGLKKTIDEILGGVLKFGKRNYDYLGLRTDGHRSVCDWDNGAVNPFHVEMREWKAIVLSCIRDGKVQPHPEVILDWLANHGWLSRAALDIDDDVAEQISLRHALTMKSPRALIADFLEQCRDRGIALEAAIKPHVSIRTRRMRRQVY